LKRWNAKPSSTFGAHPFRECVSVITDAIEKLLYDVEKLASPGIPLMFTHIAKHGGVPVSDEPQPIILQVWR